MREKIRNEEKSQQPNLNLKELCHSITVRSSVQSRAFVVKSFLSKSRMQPNINKKSLPRNIRLEHNLDEQIDWLKNNKENANNNAFNYAHITSKDTTRFVLIPLFIL